MASREENLSRLLSSAGIVTVGYLIGSMATFAERIVIGRFLTPAAYGEVSIGIALLSFGTTAALAGFSQGVPRYVPRFETDRDRRGVFVSAMLVAGVLAITITTLFFWNFEVLTTTLFERADSPQLLLLFILALPFVVGLHIAVGMIRGFGNTVYKAYSQDLLYPLTRIALLLIFLYFGYDVLAAGYAYLLAAVIAFIFSHLLLRRLIPLIGPFQTHIRRIFRFSWPIVISGFLASLLTWTDTLMLGFFRTSTEVGYYSAAYPIAASFVLVLSAFGYMYLPITSRLDADNEREEIDYIYKTTTKWIYIIAFPAFLTFVLFPGDVLEAFFGIEYVAGALALVILTIGFFSNAVGGRNRETIAALGLTKYLLFTNGTAFCLNIGLNLVLIPRFGIEGAAVASAVSYVCLNAVALVILKRKFSISPFSRWSVRTFVLLPVCLFPPLYFLSQWFSVTLITLLPFLATVGIITVVVVTVSGCLQPEDKIVIELLEDMVGIRIPFVRRYLPTR